MSELGAFWDAKFREHPLAYGDEANDFLVEVTPRLPRGRALSLGEGEGRNARHLLRHGYEVTAVDASEVGLAKARARAEAEGFSLQTAHVDLGDFDFEAGRWDVVVSIFCHLPPTLRARVHRAAFEALRPGGAFVLEAYTPAQLAHGTGGPRDPAMLYTLDILRDDLQGARFEVAEERTREVHEGPLHEGTSAVVRVLALR